LFLEAEKETNSLRREDRVLIVPELEAGSLMSALTVKSLGQEPYGNLTLFASFIAQAFGLSVIANSKQLIGYFKRSSRLFERFHRSLLHHQLFTLHFQWHPPD